MTRAPSTNAAIRLVRRSKSTMTYSTPGVSAVVDIPMSLAPKDREPCGTAGSVRSQAPSALATVRGGVPVGLSGCA